MKIRNLTLLAIFSALFLLVGCARAPATSTTSVTQTNTTNVATKAKTLCSLFTVDELNQLYGSTDVTIKKSDLVPDVLNQCDFNSAKDHKYVNGIIKPEIAAADTKKGYDDSKTYQQSNLDPKVFTFVDYKDLGTEGFAYYNKLIASVVTYQNNQFVTIAASGFATPEKNLEIAKTMAKEVLDRIK